MARPGSYKRTEEHRRIMSLALKGKSKGTVTKEHAQKISSALMGHKHSEEAKRKMSQSHTGKKISEETKKKISKANFGNKKIRLARLEKIKLSSGGLSPNYNVRACEYFKEFDKLNTAQGHHALNEGGEFFIKELGYFPDYINFDLKLIMEWDEKHHFDSNGNLKEKDLKRQEEIEKHFPDFKFVKLKWRAYARTAINC